MVRAATTPITQAIEGRGWERRVRNKRLHMPISIAAAQNN